MTSCQDGFGSVGLSGSHRSKDGENVVTKSPNRHILLGDPSKIFKVSGPM